MQTSKRTEKEMAITSALVLQQAIAGKTAEWIDAELVKAGFNLAQRNEIKRRAKESATAMHHNGLLK